MATQLKSKTAVKADQPDSIKKIKELIEEGGRLEIEIAYLAADIYNNQLYKNLGYESFGDFAKAELNIEYRKIMWLLQIGQTCIAHRITKEQLYDTNIEWTKLKEIVTVINEDMDRSEIRKLLTDAKKMSYKQVEDMVRSMKVKKVGGEVVKEEVFKFKFVGDQINTINLALEMAKEIIGTDNNSQALEYICGEWIQNHRETPATPVVKEEPEVDATVEKTKTPRKKRADVLRKEAA